MIKLKSLLKENNQNLNIIIKRVDYDTNISGIVSMTFQGNNPSDKNDFQDIINDIKQDIDSNVFEKKARLLPPPHNGQCVFCGASLSP